MPEKRRSLRCFEILGTNYTLIYYKTDNKGKAKGLPRTGHEGPDVEQMYSSTLPSIWALDEGGW